MTELDQMTYTIYGYLSEATEKNIGRFIDISRMDSKELKTLREVELLSVIKYVRNNIHSFDDEESKQKLQDFLDKAKAITETWK